MAVFRIEKTQNYTVMSNHHLRNTTLSLKAKGLLSQMLSLPENWDYTLAGLSHINRESVDAIRTAVWELEKAGYIVRRQGRDAKGKMTAIEYIIYEQPQEQSAPEEKVCPVLDFPTSGKPTTDLPTSENPTQINKECKADKKEKNTNLSSTESIPFHSPRERKGTEAVDTSAVEIYREIIYKNLDYDIMVERYPYDKERIDGIVDLILETVCTARKTIRIAGDDYSAEFVRAKFMKLDGGHLGFVLDCMKKNTTEIRNIKKYLLAVLFNAPSTIDSYYTSLVAHDMANYT
ncbi:MAG: helix-turn-helix domain-containing protein [Oscillospiraceae bacterium]|nr:helix-turn-helix domain-containing protein [Oscillospiraceae bacterium]